MRTRILWAVVGAVVASTAAQAANEVSSPVVSSSTPSRQLRVRVGMLSGMAMQKNQFEVGVGYDFAALTQRLNLLGDLTAGLRFTEVTVEPMVGVGLPITFRAVPKLHPYVAGLVGLNVTFMRGGTSMATPLRLTAGLQYDIAQRLGLGLELSLEAGPLWAPFFDTYAAAHLTVVGAWSL